MIKEKTQIQNVTKDKKVFKSFKSIPLKKGFMTTSIKTGNGCKG